VVERLPSKHKALISSPQTAKTQRKKRKGLGKLGRDGQWPGCTGLAGCWEVDTGHVLQGLARAEEGLGGVLAPIPTGSSVGRPLLRVLQQQ
jgi:hypothetical protein